jgi:hypothetical protein
MEQKNGYWEQHVGYVGNMRASQKTIGKTYGMFYSLSSFLKLKYDHIRHDFYNVVHF